MRILLVIDSFFTGGAEFSTLELFKFLKEKGIEIHICKLKQMSPEYLPEAFGLNTSFITTLPVESFTSKRKALKNLISEFKPDIIHSVLFNANLLVRTIRMFDSSFIHIESLVNHTYSKDRLNEKGVTKFKLEVYRYLDKVTAYFGTNHFHPNGYSVANHYQTKLGINPKKMTVVHRGRDGKKYHVAPYDRKEYGIDNEKVIFINVARQEFQKGQDVLLKAISILPKEILNQIYVLIVGREGKATNLLLEQIKDDNLTNYITFLGHRTDIPQLLNMADVFVFPSRFEGLPGVLIEAEAAGLPIICTDLSMMLEVVEKDKNALVFEIDNVTALALAIEKITLDENLRVQFSKKSKEIFNEKFQIESVHDKMLDLYQKLIIQ